MAKKRNYKREYAKYQSSKTQIQRRALRNKARRKAVKKGLVKKGDKKHVHHVGGKIRGKTKVISAKKNLGMREKSRKKGSTRNTRRWGKY